MDDIRIRLESVEVLGPLLAAFAVLLAVRAARRHPGWCGRPALTRMVAACYAAGFLHFTLFPIVVDRSQNEAPWTGQLELIPLLGPVSGADFTFVLNMALFVPLGLLLPLMTRRELPVSRVALRCLAASLAVELTQLTMYILFRDGRAVDVNDLIANALGGVLGCLILLRALRSPALSGAVRGFALPGTAPLRSGGHAAAYAPARA